MISRSVDLESSSLQQLQQEAKRGLKIDNLIVTGFTRDMRTRVDTSSASNKKIRLLLVELFTSIRLNGEDAGISSLLLQVAYINSSGQRELPREASIIETKAIWQAAVDTSNDVWTALRDSALKVGELNLFNNVNMQRCSLSCHALAQVDWNHPGLQRALSAVQTLSISISNRSIDEVAREPSIITDPGCEEVDGDEEDGENEEEEEDEADGDAEEEEDDDEDEVEEEEEAPLRDIAELQAEADDCSNFTGLSQLIRSCTQLESLDWHYFTLRSWSLNSVHFHPERLLQVLLRDGGIGRLKCCVLRGVVANENDLLSLLQQTLPIAVTLKAIRLHTGTWRQTLDFFASASNRVQHLHLEDLVEKGLVYFDVPGTPKVTLSGNPEGCNLLSRSGNDVRQCVSYHVPQGHYVGAPNTYQWRSEQRDEYGVR